MKKTLLVFFLLAILTTGYSQTDRFAYVITDINKDGGNWGVLRRIDLQSNAYSDILFNGNNADALAFDAATKKQMSAPFTDTRFGNVANAAFGTGVAAIAYDKKNNRLYYTPMFIDQLRYIDLKSMNVFFVNEAGIDALKTKAADQSNIVTRMAFASDGNGYALTNDGNHLLQFTTGKKITITDLGALVDAPQNSVTSVHNSCSSFGGDMIADDDGNLYVLSARNQVFQINIETKVATHLGGISGLPASFTVNGAAVSEGNRIIIASAASSAPLYIINPKTWAATAMQAGEPWRSSDLANSNLLITKSPMPPIAVLESPTEITDSRIHIYPNPVPNKRFNIQFNQLEGRYTIQVTDILGREMATSVVNSTLKGQLQPIQLPASAKAGVYLVKIVDQSNQLAYTGKIVVQ